MGCPGGMSTTRYTRSAITGKCPAVCSSLHCGTRYLIAVLAHPTAQVPRWRGAFPGGGAGSIPGRSGRTGVPSFRRCSAEPLHSGSVKYRDSRSAIALTITLPGPWPWAHEKKMSCSFWMSGNIQEVSNLFTLLVSQFTRKLYPSSNSCASTLYISHCI